MLTTIYAGRLERIPAKLKGTEVVPEKNPSGGFVLNQYLEVENETFEVHASNGKYFI